MIAKCDLDDEKSLKSYIAPAASSMQSGVRDNLPVSNDHK